MGHGLARTGRSGRRPCDRQIEQGRAAAPGDVILDVGDERALPHTPAMLAHNAVQVERRQLRVAAEAVPCGRAVGLATPWTPSLLTKDDEIY